MKSDTVAIIPFKHMFCKSSDILKAINVHTVECRACKCTAYTSSPLSFVLHNGNPAHISWCEIVYVCCIKCSRLIDV